MGVYPVSERILIRKSSYQRITHAKFKVVFILNSSHGGGVYLKTVLIRFYKY
nr:MAG TPA: hypothetical protein [Caudoviricetes sp.]